jgi:hypothetical protein
LEIMKERQREGIADAKAEGASRPWSQGVQKSTWDVIGREKGASRRCPYGQGLLNTWNYELTRMFLTFIYAAEIFWLSRSMGEYLAHRNERAG